MSNLSNLNDPNQININSLKDFQRSQESLKDLGAIHIGNVISWEITNDVNLKYEDYLAIAESLGIPKTFLVEKKSPIVAFGQAWKTATRPKELKAVELKHTRSQGDYLLVALYKWSAKGQNVKDVELETQHEITLAFKKVLNEENGQHTITINPKTQEYIEWSRGYYQEILSLYEKFLNVTQRDIQNTCARFARAHGISTQPRGGSYFIPKKYDKLCAAFDQLIEKVSAKSVFFQIPSYSSPTGDRSIGKAASKSLFNEIDELDVEVFQLCLTESVAESHHQKLGSVITNLQFGKPNQAIEILDSITPLCSALKKKCDGIKDAIADNLSTQQELLDMVFDLKDKIQVKQGQQRTLDGHLSELNQISGKILDFQDFLSGEGDRLVDALTRINTYASALYRARFGTAPRTTLEIAKLQNSGNEELNGSVQPTTPISSNLPPQKTPEESIDIPEDANDAGF